jgi:hypothetical protein
MRVLERLRPERRVDYEVTIIGYDRAGLPTLCHP